MKYKYKIKWVNSTDEFIKAIDEGYMNIRIPNRFRHDVLERLSTLKKKNDDYLFAYASCQYNFIDTVTRKKEAYDAALKLVKNESLKGYIAMGYCYRAGLGVEKDINKALEWFLKGATLGEAICIYWVAGIYAHELKKPEDAVQFYEEAAKKGLSNAKNNLYFMYRDGEGVKKDPQKAIKLLIEAAEEGDETAQENLALCYRRGEIVERSPNDAIYWYLKAASKGSKRAIDSLLNSYGLDYIFSRLKIKKPNE